MKTYIAHLGTNTNLELALNHLQEIVVKKHKGYIIEVLENTKQILFGLNGEDSEIKSVEKDVGDIADITENRRISAF